MVIDDDDGFRTALADALQAARYEVLEAADGQKALAIIEQLHGGIDLLVVDLCLPEVNGFEVIGAITRHQSNMKVLATSGVYKEPTSKSPERLALPNPYGNRKPLMPLSGLMRLSG